MILGENSVLQLSSFSNDSLIMLIPIKANKIKAIQWSMLSILSLN